MAKIKKNLSDEEMLRGFSESLSFENGIYVDEKLHQPKIKAKAEDKKELLLPDDAQEKLNRFLLELSMEWMKNRNGACSWKVAKESGQIVIKPVALAKK